MNKLIFANLIHRPLRSIISVLAVAIEVVMILSIVAIFMGMLNDQKPRASRLFVKPRPSSPTPTPPTRDRKLHQRVLPAQLQFLADVIAMLYPPSAAAPPVGPLSVTSTSPLCSLKTNALPPTTPFPRSTIRPDEALVPQPPQAPIGLPITPQNEIYQTNPFLPP